MTYTQTARAVLVSGLQAGDRVVLEDGRQVTIAREPYRHWSGAVVVRVPYASIEGPGWFERYPDDVVRVTERQGAQPWAT